jgi:predicted ATP-binding protein involved in virulence
MLSRLSEFRVEGLFGLYDHRIALNLEDRITIIIGPNGRGKTVCLKIIEALFRNRYAYTRTLILPVSVRKRRLKAVFQGPST